MKKLSLLLVVLSLVLISCGNKAPKTGAFHQTLDQAADAAAKTNKDILVVFTMEGDDATSAQFIKDVLSKNEFQTEICNKYEIVQIDFGQSSYERTVVKDDADKKSKAQAEAYADLMQDNTKFANLLNLQTTPSFYIFSKEKYYICQLDPIEEISSVNQFNEIIAVAQPAIDDVHGYINTIQTGSDAEKLVAINDFYDATDATYRVFIYDLIIQYMKLDKKNETGLLGKYTLARADLDAVNLYADGDPMAAAKKYADVAQDLSLTAEQKQQAYYMAAYLLTIGGSPDYQPIMRYLKNALDSAPDSPAVPHIKQIYDSFVQMVEMGN